MKIRVAPKVLLAGEQLEKFRAARAEQERRRSEEERASLLRTAPPAIFDDRAFGLHGLRSPCLPRGDQIVRSRSHMKELCRKYNIHNISRGDCKP